MTDIEQFVPRPQPIPPDIESWREAISILKPDLTTEQLNEHLALFLAMKQRVEYPCRRVGADIRRAGPVLFDPCHFIRGQESEE